MLRLRRSAPSEDDARSTRNRRRDVNKRTRSAVGPAWGAGIGLGLNDTGGAMPMKLAYDAAAHDVIGFAVEITGDTNGNELRIGFTADAAPAGASPFVAVPGAGSYDILLSDALVPASWDVPYAGDTVVPRRLRRASDRGNGVAGPFDSASHLPQPIRRAATTGLLPRCVAVRDESS